MNNNGFKDYHTLLFDIDNTLLDFAAAEEVALAKLFALWNEEVTEDLLAAYDRINDELWQAYERCEMSLDTVLNSRFSRLFAGYGKARDGVDEERLYQGFLAAEHQQMPCAREVVSALSKERRLYIVTNGVGTTQERRMKEAGLAPYFQGMFFSDEIGFPKPRPEFFEHVFTSIPAFDKDRTLIIGDSLTSDIAGGRASGIDTCWLNPRHKANTRGIRATYMIHELTELCALLEGELGLAR